MPGHVLGLDILPRRKGPTKFASVLISNEGIILDRRKIKRNELTKYINEKKVEIIGIDNIWEINEERNHIKQFIKETQVDLVQVTGKPGNTEKISYLAKEYNLHTGGKLSPVETAEIAARLVLMGEGARVKAIRDQTKISVVRSRSLGTAGGQRQAGFERSISAMVQSVVRDIKQNLRKNNLRFDIFSRKKKHGIGSARFLVYAPYQNVRKIVKELDTKEIRVEIEPVERNHLTFLEPEEEFKGERLFCGIDPGRTVGAAILRLDGRVVKTYSKRGIQIGELIGQIYKHGRPILIATDVSEVPYYIERIRKKCKARKWYPSKDIPTSEKWEIIREMGADVSNTHERDALVAAFRAWENWREKFNKIDKITSYLPLPVDKGEIKELVVNDETIAMAISKVLSRKLNTRKKEKQKKSVSVKLGELKKERDDLLGKVAALQEDKDELREWVSELRTKIKEREEKIDELEWKIEEERKKRKLLKKRKIEEEIEEEKSKKLERLQRTKKHLKKKVTGLKNQLENKRQEISTLHKLLDKKDDEVVIKIIDSFTKQKVRNLVEKYAINEDDVLWVINHSTSCYLPPILLERGVRAIIAKDDFPLQVEKRFENAEIPIIAPKDFSPPLSRDMKVQVVSETRLEEARENAKIRQLPEKEKRYKMLEKSIEEYKKSRS